jgi:hypothetical protein
VTWFSRLTGVEEFDVRVQELFELLDENTSEGMFEGKMEGKIRFPNGRVTQYGALTHHTLGQLRERTADHAHPFKERTTLRQIVADVTELHTDPSNNGALFQVASQFNLLEMVGPHVTPERGVTGYIHDRTQGPLCAISAPAGTIYRNYFAHVRGQRGQTHNHQIDGIYEIGLELGNQDNELWTMRNGYLMPTEGGLQRIFDQLTRMDHSELDHLRSLLRVGVQWNTEVADTLQPVAPQSQFVQQAYCSALPVSYAGGALDLWAPFAQLVLEAAYEHTLRSAVINAQERGVKTVYLTYVGGGVFGNDMAWIHEAILYALCQVEWAGLDVVCVSHGRASRETDALIERWSN